MKAVILALLLLVAGVAAGWLGFVAGAVIGVLLGLFALVRSFVVLSPAGRQASGPGQSGPGEPGYHGSVGVGEEGGSDARRAG